MCVKHVERHVRTHDKVHIMHTVPNSRACRGYPIRPFIGTQSVHQSSKSLLGTLVLYVWSVYVCRSSNSVRLRWLQCGAFGIRRHETSTSCSLGQSQGLSSGLKVLVLMDELFESLRLSFRKALCRTDSITWPTLCRHTPFAWHCNTVL